MIRNENWVVVPVAGRKNKALLAFALKGDYLIKNDIGFTCFFVGYSVLMLRLDYIPFLLETD